MFPIEPLECGGVPRPTETLWDGSERPLASLKFKRGDYSWAFCLPTSGLNNTTRHLFRRCLFASLTTSLTIRPKQTLLPALLTRLYSATRCLSQILILLLWPIMPPENLICGSLTGANFWSQVQSPTRTLGI